MRGRIRIAVLGLGTVGSGVLWLLERNRTQIRKRLGADLEVVGVAVRNVRRARPVRVTRDQLTTNARALATRADVDVVVEMMGGLEPARTLMLDALAAGKDVVTANKALLAVHGDEIFEAAERGGVRLGFEASVAGGIPIIRTLRDALAGDRNRALYGIVNGTSNSVLTDMTERGGEFHDALRAAQRDGLAEADPRFDIDGTDSAHKLALLVMLAFGAACPFGKIHREGIQEITQVDVQFARELGYVIKLLSIAKDHGRSIEARVHPTMVPERHLLADVRGPFNAINVQGEALGSTLYVGQGAGRLPTATSVVGDIVEIARQRRRDETRGAPPLGIPWRQLRRIRVRPIGEVESESYLRFLVVDRPGVLGRIAGILGRHGISIASVIQRERGRRASVPIVIRTHEAQERKLRQAIEMIARLPAVRGRPLVLPIEDRL